MENSNSGKVKNVKRYLCRLKQDTFGSLSGEESKKLSFETSYDKSGLVIHEVRYSANGQEEEVHDNFRENNFSLEEEI